MIKLNWISYFNLFDILINNRRILENFNEVILQNIEKRISIKFLKLFERTSYAFVNTFSKPNSLPTRTSVVNVTSIMELKLQCRREVSQCYLFIQSSRVVALYAVDDRELKNRGKQQPAVEERQDFCIPGVNNKWKMKFHHSTMARMLAATLSPLNDGARH